MSKFADGIRGLAMGMVIAVEVPVAVVKTVIGNALHKKQPENKTEIEVKEVDISKCEPEAREWMRRCYEKKNGIA